MSTYDKLTDIPLEVEAYELEPLEQAVSSDFTRLSTVIHMRGGGHEGVGEDVTYDATLHPAFQALLPTLPLAGEWTLASLSARLDGIELFEAPPEQAAYVAYRRWAMESAALDLALRQAGTSLAAAVGRTPRPVVFVCSLNLGHPPSLDGLRRRLEANPQLRFKLDATSDWDDQIFAELVERGCVDSVDFKGAYHGTVVDQAPDPVLYKRCAETFPEAWLEDPNLTPETDEVLRPHRDRITWDAPIHSVADVEGLPFPPLTVNVKPSRFGPLEALFACYDHLAEHRIGAYGGGQFELGPGRGQIQALASLFHADAPNDIAPVEYNLPEPPAELVPSPLEPRLDDVGFRWV